MTAKQTKEILRKEIAKFYGETTYMYVLRKNGWWEDYEDYRITRRELLNRVFKYTNNLEDGLSYIKNASCYLSKEKP